ncbi:QueT transporter family protein [Candidatus Bathyarchaeota archaeon]|nr:QueT transporter family protein [Candidatus Bathyarchaeota archaeon]
MKLRLFKNGYHAILNILGLLFLCYLAGEWASTRSATTNPGVGGERVKIESRSLTLTAVFAALYVVLNVLQMVSVGNPTVYGPIQLRVADCLIALVALFGWPAVGGVTLGCFIVNAYYFLGVQDVIFGPIANLIAACIILLLHRHRFIGCIAGALPIGLMVGAYLSIFFPFLTPPEVLSVLPAIAAMIVSLTISSLIAIAGIGYLLLTVISRPSILGPLESRGLKTTLKRKG